MSLCGPHWSGGGSCSLPLSGKIIVRAPVALMWCHKDQPPAGTLVVILLIVCMRIVSFKYLEPFGSLHELDQNGIQRRFLVATDLHLLYINDICLCGLQGHLNVSAVI